METLKNNLIQPISVVCNDAGSANIIAHWILKNKISYINFSLKGPAKKIFNEKFSNLKNYPLKKNVANCKMLLSGTGHTDFEHQARLLAKEKKIKSVAVIDHWTNYSLRFKFNNTLCMPDEIWVTDEYALKLAKKEFINVNIKLFENLYLKHEIAKVKELRSKNYLNNNKNFLNILYVLEPIYEKWRGIENLEGEFQALKFFTENLHLLKINKNNCKIFLRPHPSETRDKYVKWIRNNNKFNFKLVPRKEKLCISLSKVDWVVGCNTYAMVIALMSNINVASTLPPNAPECMLPFKEIIKLKNLC